ncbi:hypothetical protein Jab_1c06980 [Janthinobacterium sp. HH01]|nr:hypothetical protein Jab_1c06980 [Janthinobacterium sp. HH01]
MKPPDYRTKVRLGIFDVNRLFFYRAGKSHRAWLTPGLNNKKLQMINFRYAKYQLNFNLVMTH